MQKHITIILPLEYRGGSLRVTKTIAKMIRSGSSAAGEPCVVRVAVLAGKYNPTSDFEDLHAAGIDVREFEWETFSAEAVDNANYLQGRAVSVSGTHFQSPRDGLKNLTDSDLWLLVSDRTDYPLAPIRPYTVFATDYIQRYVPEIFDKQQWGAVDMPFLQTARYADAVITTTPQTRSDAISYVGLPADRVRLAPMDFDPTAFPDNVEPYQAERPYIIWPTNIAPHKNHVRAFEALKQYYEALNGTLDVKIVGVNTQMFSPRIRPEKPYSLLPHLVESREAFRRNRSLHDHVEIMGELSDREYARVLAGASFLWHPTIYDNGTFAIAEAAWFGVPALSSGYPQMRYISERFSIPMPFFNARSPDNMAKALKQMESEADSYRERLPSRKALSQHSWQRYAGEYWQMISGILEEVGEERSF